MAHVEGNEGLREKTAIRLSRFNVFCSLGQKKKYKAYVLVRRLIC